MVALEEIGVPFDYTFAGADRSTNEAYLAVNPKGKVPALVVDGVLFTETTAIVTHLARTYPEARLLPTGDPFVEIDALSTMSWFAAGIHPLIFRMRFPMRVNDDPSSFARTREIAGKELTKAFGILETRLADRSWLFDDWSIVDAYLLWTWFRSTGSGMDGSPFTRCADHARRCEYRPSVARVLDLEEAEHHRLKAEGRLSVDTGAYAVGRSPATTLG
jgi:glutathione S-transferase